MVTFAHLDKARKEEFLPRLFDLLYENMRTVAPSALHYEEEKAQWLAQVSPALCKAPRQILLCFSDGMLAGFVMYYVREQMLMVEELQLSKAFRRTGVFGKLCRALADAVPEDIQWVEAYADKRNSYSLGILNKLGMQPMEEEPFFVHLRGSAETIRSKLLRRKASVQRKKLFVVSDVHGHETLLRQALAAAGYDKENEDHLLICCGDYFDRGSENDRVLRFFERLPRKVLLRGNHEDLLLKVLQTGKLLPHNYINGTLQTLQNFFGKYIIDPADDTLDLAGKTGTVDRICEFIGETADYFETEHYVFIHGWLPRGGHTPEGRRAASGEDWAAARWLKWTEHYTGSRPAGEKTLVCGHVPAFMAGKHDPLRPKDCADIFYGNGLTVIDAGTFDSQQINVLVLEDTLLAEGAGSAVTSKIDSTKPEMQA